MPTDYLAWLTSKLQECTYLLLQHWGCRSGTGFRNLPNLPLQHWGCRSDSLPGETYSVFYTCTESTLHINSSPSPPQVLSINLQLVKFNDVESTDTRGRGRHLGVLSTLSYIYIYNEQRNTWTYEQIWIWRNDS